MQPNNNMANSTAPAPAPMTTPMNPGSDVVFKDKPKKNISRYPIGTDFSADPSGSLGQLIFSDENYDYYYRNPQSTFSSNESDIDLEVKTVDSMKQIFTNKNNYSKI